MADSIVVKFPSGNIVQFGTSDGGSGAIAAREQIAEKTGEVFDKAMGALGDVVARLEACIGSLERKPDGVEVSFAASLKGNCDLWVVSGDGEAEFTVTLKWDNRKS